MGPRGLADVGRMTFDAKAFIAEQTEAIHKQVPGKAIIACSGGVDSTTAAVLASHALGDRLLAVYVDTGLMRKDETEDVARTVKELKVNHRILRARTSSSLPFGASPIPRKNVSSSGTNSLNCSSGRQRPSVPTPSSRGRSRRTGSRAADS